MAKILVVDDSDVAREHLCKVLSDNGHTILCGQDGISGANVAQLHPDLDLIITDISMPQVDGIEMLTRIAKARNNRPIPAIAVTNEIDDRMKAVAKSLGVLIWVIKPINAETLPTAVAHCLERTAAATGKPE